MVALVHDEESDRGHLEERAGHHDQEDLVDQDQHLEEGVGHQVQEDLVDKHQHL